MSISVLQLQSYKKNHRPIIALTAWDYPFGLLLDEVGVDLILVGDSLAMVALGHSSTIPLTLDEILHHAKAVRRGVKRSLLVCDLPFMSYQGNSHQALTAAGRCLKEAQVDAVKVEGGYPKICKTIAKMVQVGIPVLGHVGLTPQSVKTLGWRQQGQSPQDSQRILGEALALEEAGVFAIVLEHMPPDLAATITDRLTIPTLGIGAGPDCDGQILVTADLLGLSQTQPPFAKAYTDLRSIAKAAVSQFCQEVQNRQFPATPPKNQPTQDTPSHTP